MPATTPPKGQPTPKRDAQRRNRRRGLPHELQERSTIVTGADSDKPEVRDISGFGVVPPQDIVGYGSITLPSITANPDKE
jgi:hypothetical protein